MTFEQAYNAVKKKLANKNAKNVENFAIQITLTDEEFGGTLYAQVKDGILYVEPYDYKDNNAILNISKTALSNYLARRKSLNRVISEGAVVYGDYRVIEILRNLPEEAPKKPKRANKATDTTPKKRGRKPKSTK